MRAERQAFLNEIARNTPRFPRMIYSAGSDRIAEGKIDTVTIVLDLDWPMGNAPEPTASDLLNSVEKAIVAGTIFRVKDFLERQLMAEISLLDIRAGCVRVRYRTPDGLSFNAVLAALRALMENRELFSVLEAKANIGGQAVRV